MPDGDNCNGEKVEQVKGGKLVKENFAEKMIVEQRLKEVREETMLFIGKNISGGGNSKCKSPVAGLCPAF